MAGALRRLGVVLASQSPRRRELLSLIGVSHEVIPADIDETLHPEEIPIEHVERLAREKSALVALRRPNDVVIGADTIVVLDGEVLGKPSHASEAIATITRLSGRTHTVHTAVAVSCGGHTASAVESVEVTFRKLDREQIESYVATLEPMDKAGAYGIQGYGATIVERIHGDYFAVMGLPLGRLVLLLKELGLRYGFDGSVTAERGGA